MKNGDKVLLEADFDTNRGDGTSVLRINTFATTGLPIIAANEDIHQATPVMVPSYVKDDLDRLFKKDRGGLTIAGMYWRSTPELATETRRWISTHDTEFMYALVYGYKAETEKQYVVPVPKMNRMYYRIPYDNDLDKHKGTLSWLICYGSTPKTDKRIRFTMDQLKKYGLENYDHEEVEDC